MEMLNKTEKNEGEKENSDQEWWEKMPRDKFRWYGYFNREDERLFIWGRKYGIGWTINSGHPYAKYLYLLILLILCYLFIFEQLGKFKILFTRVVSAVTYSIILFLAARKILYIQGWIFSLTSIIWTSIHVLAFPKDKMLIKEHIEIKEDAKSWDKVLVGTSVIVYVINIIVAGLDTGRFHWSPNSGWSIYSFGIIMITGGNIIIMFAYRKNIYFSSIVRIQKERGHTVCDRGIYKLVRHPAYLGMIMFFTGIPLITGSLWSGVPATIAIILFLIRTKLEDKTLKVELEGYIDYTKRTRHKILPFIW